jgi:hypothetical protein
MTLASTLNANHHPHTRPVSPVHPPREEGSDPPARRPPWHRPPPPGVAQPRRAAGSPRSRPTCRDKSDCHFRKTAADYYRKPSWYKAFKLYYEVTIGYNPTCVCTTPAAHAAAAADARSGWTGAPPATAAHGKTVSPGRGVSLSLGADIHLSVLNNSDDRMSL